MLKLRHIPFILLAVVTILLATATFVPDGTHIYTAWWMITLWALLAASALLVILRAKLHRRPATFLLHMAFLFILAGALVTHLWGKQGSVHLYLGATENTFINSAGNTVEQLPFALTLSDFRIETYPGTQSPMDYVSTISIRHNGTSDGTLRVSMNHIGTYGGYRFYQSGYSPDLQGTSLSVSHDPWGIGLTYAGYGLLFLSMLLLMVLPGEGFRRLLRQKAALVLALLSLFPALSTAAPQTLPQEQATKMGDLYIYYNGRISPLQTMARDLTTKLCGRPAYQNYSAEQVLAGYMLFPTSWTPESIIKVKPAVARLLGIDGKFASYEDFFDADGYKLQPMLDRIRSGQHVDEARAISEADEKMNILLMLFNGQLLKLFPYSTQHGRLEWFSASDRFPADMPREKWTFIRNVQDYMGELAQDKDYAQLNTVLEKIRTYQQNEGGKLLPSDMKFQAEKLYNTLDYTRPLAMVLLTLGIVSFVVTLIYWLRQKTLPWWLRLMLNGVLVVSLLYLLTAVCLRGYISGHLPLSNGFETMQFLSLCTLVLTLLLQRRMPLLLPFGLLLGGLTLLVAMMGGANPQLTPLMPVLASPLLSLHVCIIMLAYSLLAFILLIGLTALALNAIRGNHEQQLSQLTRFSHLLLYPAVFCLAAGIFIGAIWANQSWGRYWGWDPKETWALITLLAYSVALHRQSLRWLQRPLWYHLYVVLCFLSILMTYFGVNFFLGGMHSYA